MNSPAVPPPDVAPAHALWVQLVTQITTRHLHYRSGEEETAAESVASLFQSVRELLTKHPEARLFREVALTMLNGVIRPYTARWHGWMMEDRRRSQASEKPVQRLRDERVRRMFRAELQELQSRLGAYLGMLEVLARPDGQVPGSPQRGEVEDATAMDQILGHGLAKRLQSDQTSRSTDADLGTDELTAGIGKQVQMAEGCPVEEINRWESWRIDRRRAMWSGRTVDEETTPSANRAPLKNAIGLALSGGGIRSATFSLGATQVLVRQGLFQEFDYLSTVSGGGYFGGFLSCALGTRQPGDATPATRESARVKLEDVFQRQQGIESGLLRHLRNHSKYLLHGGVMGKLRVLGLLLSGMAWNLMIVLPIPLFAAGMAVLLGPWFWGEAVLATGPLLPPIRESPAGLVLMWLAILFGVMWIGLPGIQKLAHGKPPKSRPALVRALWENIKLGLGLATIIAGVIFAIPALFHAQEWLRIAVDDLRTSDLDLGTISGLLPASLTGLAGALLAALACWLGPHWPRLRAVAVRLFILSGPLLCLLVFLLVSNRLGIARAGDAPWNWYWVLGIAVVLVVWEWLFVNINTLAPHRYYRNRLCECYLVRRIRPEDGEKQTLIRALSGERAQGRTEVLKQVKLSELGKYLTAPYHLMNMTINAPASREKNLRGRGGDFFVVSREFYGSPLTGYARTKRLEEEDPHFDLGTAMAVSGAAASSSMGVKTLPHLRLLMTLFNVRLGYWLPHPNRVRDQWLPQGAGPKYFFQEMFGHFNEHSHYVNLSDGGHLENLAVYELLRRRCKFIVCIDGGCEPGMECSDLIRIQRYAEIDLGIRMHFDIGDLQIEPNQLSRAHAILVKIDYDPDPTATDDEDRSGEQLGWMLYLKLAMTGVEPAYVKDYRRDHPDFPHQTTGDQIYEEEQFEAYRALGECAMEGLFRKELVGQKAPATVRDWFQCLANNLLPDNDPAFQQRSH